MANQLYHQLMTPPQATADNTAQKAIADSVKRMANMLGSSNNPQQIIQRMAQTNPQMGAIMNMLNTSGMTPKGLFYTMARQQGIDPNRILAMLQS